VNVLDEKTFSNLFREWYQSLTNFAFRYVDDEQKAQDLVQDAFVSIWNNRSSLQIKSSIKNYLFTTVRNNSLAYLKRMEAEKGVVGISLQLFPEENEMEIELNRINLKVKIKRAMTQLPPKCMEAFKLCKFEGLTQEEAAKHMGVSVKTIEKQVAKAYKILRPLLKR